MAKINAKENSFEEVEEQGEEGENATANSSPQHHEGLWCSGAGRRRRNPDFKSIDI